MFWPLHLTSSCSRWEEAPLRRGAGCCARCPPGARGSRETGLLSEILVDAGIERLPENLTAWIADVRAEYEKARAAAADLLERSRHLAETSDALAERYGHAVRVRFPRRLFAIGYQVGGPVNLTAHYDLLASEARLTSLVAIAKGDVPVEHWLALGRPYTSATARSCFRGAAPCSST
jgi:cyclic beta-1,2-glucan synthetase